MLPSPMAKKMCALLVLLFSFVAASQAQSAWTSELELKVKTVGAVRVSPDGKKVVYTVSSPVMAPDKSEFVTQIWLANTDGSDPVQLTYAEKSSDRSEEHTSELQSLAYLVCRLLLEKKKKKLK